MKPKIYAAKDHKIREDHIDADALSVIERLRNAGFLAYLVGGGVRDLLLDRQPKDFDISTSAEPEQVKRLFRNCLLIGRRFRLAHIRFGKKIIEVSTFRQGDTEEASLIVRDNEWGTPEEDVLRRDFTINGLFYDSEHHQVIDYVGGYEDLKKNLLRVIGDPETRFVQDPVRMIRCLKFRARFGFSIDPAILQAIGSCSQEILKSAPARVLEEILRMLESGASESFFRLLEEYGFIDQLLPHIARGIHTIDRETFYRYLCAGDQWVHAAVKRPPHRSVLAAALFYPFYEHHLQEFHQQSERPPNLGDVFGFISDYIDEALNGAFVQIPRRMCASIAQIFDTQYRMTPLTSKKIRKNKLVTVPDFLHALQFLKMRSLVDTSLNNTYLSWKELYLDMRRK